MTRPIRGDWSRGARRTPAPRAVPQPAEDLELQSVGLRTAAGSKLRVAGDAGLDAFEVDGYDPATGSGFRVLVTGRTELVLDDAETARLDRLGRCTMLCSTGTTRD